MLRNTKNTPLRQILQEDETTPQQIMEHTSQLFQQAEPVLLWYTLNHTITYGHFIKPEALVHLDQASQHNIRIAKRPTGGGATFHFKDLSFCIVVPHTHQFYQNTPKKTIYFLSKSLQKALSTCTNQKISMSNQEITSQAIPLCSMQHAYGDLLIDQKKCCGIALRKNQRAALFQISIFLEPLPFGLLNTIMRPPFDQNSIEKGTTPLLCCKEKLKKAIVNAVITS